MNLMKKNGFTLIELLIVITILSVLATIGFVVYFGITPKARDTRRIGDLNKLAIALELYYQDNGQFMDGTLGSEGNCSGSDTGAFNTLIANYITDNDVLKDPQTKSPYCYISVSGGKSFRLFAKLENCLGSGGNLCGSTNYNYSVYSDDLTIAAAANPPQP